MGIFNFLRRAGKGSYGYRLSDLEDALGFELPDNSIMFEHMGIWLSYMQNRAPYLYEGVGRKRKNAMKTLCLPSTVSREFAKISLLDYDTKITQGSKAEWLQEMHDSLVKPILSDALQWALGLGNVCFKPTYRNGRVGLEYVFYPNFIPVSWDDGGLTEVIFKSALNKGSKVYTLIEHMKYSGGYFTVSYYAFMRDSNISYGSDLGNAVNVKDVAEWAELEDIKVETGRAWFVLMKTPVLNNVDPDSPLGVSVMSNSMDAIQSADEAYSALAWEMQASKNRTMLPEDMFSKDESGNAIVPDSEDRYFIITKGDPVSGGRPEQFAPAIREQNYINDIKFQLQMLETQLSLSEGTFSTEDMRSGGVTATEVIADKIETMNTVTHVLENMIKPAVLGIIDVFAEMTDVFGISVDALAKKREYDVSIEVNTAANINTSERFTQAMELYRERLVPRYYPILYSLLQVSEAEAKELSSGLNLIVKDEADGR